MYQVRDSLSLWNPNAFRFRRIPYLNYTYIYMRVCVGVGGGPLNKTAENYILDAVPY